jgi:hypothetical protein
VSLLRRQVQASQAIRQPLTLKLLPAGFAGDPETILAHTHRRFRQISRIRPGEDPPTYDLEWVRIRTGNPLIFRSAAASLLGGALTIAQQVFRQPFNAEHATLHKY